MRSKHFIDTNIFLDLILDRGKFGKHSKDFFIKAIQQKMELCTSISCIQTTIYVLAKRKLPKTEISESISYLNQLVSFVHTYTENVAQALKSELPDLEDAILYYSAISNDCNTFITQNIKDFPHNSELIEVITPQEFLSK